MRRKFFDGTDCKMEEESENNKGQGEERPEKMTRSVLGFFQDETINISLQCVYFKTKLAYNDNNDTTLKALVS